MAVFSEGTSHVGRVRSHNEDQFLINERLGLFIVADGMGGANAGEVASQMAVDTISMVIHRSEGLLRTYESDPSEINRKAVLKLLESAIQTACRDIHLMAQNDESRSGMGTTTTMMVIVGQSAFVGHVGDSRLYLLRKDQVYQITEDHTLLQEQIRKGMITKEEAEEFPYKNVITRAVGVFEQVDVETLHMELEPGDRFVLCSDGLHNYLGGHEMRQIFERQSLHDGIRQMIAQANSRGGKDNITTIAVEVVELQGPEQRVNASKKLNSLRKIPMFAHLTYQELVKTLNIARLETVEAGDMIIREGEQGQNLYILVDGQVDILKENLYVTSLYTHGHFGEMALITHDARSASVRAAKPTDLLIINRDDFFGLINNEPRLSNKVLLSLLRSLSGRLRDTTTLLSDAKKTCIDKGCRG